MGSLSPLGSILVSLATGIGLIFIGGLWYRHLKKWKQQDLMAMEMKALIHALCNLNHGIGPEFKKLFEPELDRLMKRSNYVNDVK